MEWKFKKGEREEIPANANPNFPKIVIDDKTGTARAVTSGTVTLSSNEKFFLQPPDSNFGATYDYLTYSDSTGAYVIKYQKPTPAYWYFTAGSTPDRFSFEYKGSMSTLGTATQISHASVVADTTFTTQTIATTDGSLIYIFTDRGISALGSTALTVYALHMDTTTAWTRTLPSTAFSSFSTKEGMFYINIDGSSNYSIVKLNPVDGTDQYTIPIGVVSGSTGQNAGTHLEYFDSGTILAEVPGDAVYAVDLVNKTTVNMTTAGTSDIMAGAF